METTTIIAIAGSVTLGVFGKFAYDGIRHRNSKSSYLKSHDDSATAHPDIRVKMTNMNEKIENIDDRTILMDDKLDRLLDNN